MRVILKVEYRPEWNDAPSYIVLSKSRMQKDFVTKRTADGFEITINPDLDYEYEGKNVKALLEALDDADNLIGGLSLLIEAAFLTGVEIGKKKK